MFSFIRLFLILFFTTALSFKPFAATKTPLYQVQVVTEYLEPYQIAAQDGSLTGFSTEVIHALFAQANSEATISVMPWARAYEIAQNHENTLIYSIARTPTRDKRFHWIGSLKEERLYFWGLKTKFPYPIDTIALLKGYRIAASRDSNVAEFLIANDFFNVYQLIKEDQNMLMLYKDRVDLIVATELTLRKRAKKLGVDFDQMTRIAEVKALNNDLSIAFSLKSDPKMVQHFQQAFTEINSKGVIDSLKKKWQIN